MAFIVDRAALSLYSQKFRLSSISACHDLFTIKDSNANFAMWDARDENIYSC